MWRWPDGIHGSTNKNHLRSSSMDQDASRSLHHRSCSEDSQTRPGAAEITKQNEIPSSPAVQPRVDSPYSPLSPSAPDRVFPIRSVVSVDPNPTPSVRSDGWDFFSGSDRQSTCASPIETPSRLAKARANVSASTNLAGARTRRRTGSTATDGDDLVPRQMRIAADTTSTKSAGERGSIRSASISRSIRSGRSGVDDMGGIITARFKHVLIEGDHAVITGRDGDTLQRCEDEPIHIPGAIQGFGLLVAFQEDVDGKLVIRIVSENSKHIIGYTPKQLFALDSFCDILSEEQTDNLLDHLDFIRDGEADPETNGPEVFTMSIRSPSKNKARKLWCAMHINQNNPDMIICEFELEDDTENPLVPPGSSTPEPPEDTLNSNPTAQELAESTINSSRPLRVLRSARKRKGETAAMEVFNILAQVQEQLANAPDLEVFLKVLVGVVKELTGFHRVMIYQFDQLWNGRVVTELVDPRVTKDLYKGLNFPASDIPKQARDLYKINKVRLLYDRDLKTARLVCRTLSDLETPLDLTFSYLRAMSPIHLKYLANMAVRASMSISINAFGELWGLIACHSYGPKGMRVSFPIRKMCRLIGDSASRNIERLSYASRLQARKLINTVPTEKNPSGYIVASSDDLLRLFDADYGLVSIVDETKILGNLEASQEALALLEYLRLRKFTSVITSQDIRLDFPDLRYPPGFSVIAGLLLVPLSGDGDDFIVFLRKGQLREVKWAGDPYSKYVKEGTEGYLEPRKSFKTWTEIVTGKCRQWSEDQTETAAVLCLVYGKFIEVWRQKEAALQKSQLTRLLLANSAHEVRTPLNAIINYLEIAMEGKLDQETRESLAKSHAASKSLIYVINDLLDLTKTEEGKELMVTDTVFDLHATVREATEMFRNDAIRKQLDFVVTENPGVPQFVIGDQRRIRQAVSNLTANAIQNTVQGSVKVDVWLAHRIGSRVEIDIAVQDTGAGMSAKRLDTLFRELEQVQTEQDVPWTPSDASGGAASVTAGPGKRIIGLGLALVSRIVRNMDGQLRLKSEEGKGSRFVIQLGFNLPEKAKSIEVPAAHDLSSNPITPSMDDGEFMLMRKNSLSSSKAFDRPSHELGRRGSRESVNSLNSLKSFRSGSSARSDVDRMIEAIRESSAPANTSTTRARSVERNVSKIKGPRPAFRRTSTDKSTGGTDSIKTSLPSRSDRPGQAFVTSQVTPIKPVRMPDEADGVQAAPEAKSPHIPGRVLFDIPLRKAKELRAPKTHHVLGADHFRVLVAEDDPINSKIISKRLEKLGHEVCLTVNGEACADVYADNVGRYDAILMDIQMPIADGLTSTKMIRSHEKTHPCQALSNGAASNGRIPIFAVSASLIERNKQEYVDIGFDGWILKPVDFRRLNELLSGILDSRVREKCLYAEGHWERGGWFGMQQPGVDAASTKPSREAQVHGPPPRSFSPETENPFLDPISKEQERLDSLDTNPINAQSRPENPGTSGSIDSSGGPGVGNSTA